MKFLVKKDKNMRRKVFDLESLSKVIRVVRNCSEVNNFFIVKKSFSSRVRNRCFLTGKSVSIYRKFHLSRMRLRELAHEGILVGLKKSSW